MTLFVVTLIMNFMVISFSSLVEALILSVRTTDIEALKKRNPKKGERLEKMKQAIEETSSAILTMNTMATALGSMILGGVWTGLFGGETLLAFSIVFSVVILLFGEILPKNIGVMYRSSLIEYFVYPLWGLCYVMRPFSVVCRSAIRLFLKSKAVTEEADTEILLLAEKSLKEGGLSNYEQAMIANALSLDNIFVSSIMTPRNVAVGFDAGMTVDKALQECPIIPFSRMMVYDKEMDNVVGLIRRRDILKAKANNHSQQTIASLQQSILFIPSNVTAADALAQFLKHHQQFAAVVDEFGVLAGVLTMEDIVEHIIGQEIFEKDDIAVDMRVLARSKRKRLTEEF